jgi:hypothetical protein
MTAGVALLGMATERRRPADLDRRHHTALCRGRRSTVPLTIGVAVAAEHIRHFRSRPTHFVRPLRRAMARSAWSGWESGTAADPMD